MPDGKLFDLPQGKGAAFTNRRVLQPLKARIIVAAGVLLLALAALFVFFPRTAAYPLLAIFRGTTNCGDKVGATLNPHP